MKEDKVPPDGAAGPYVISGNNWFVFRFQELCLLCRLILCRELLGEMAADDPTRPYLETFEMSIYCFPDPTDAEQRLLIRTIGFADNVIGI